jgi:oligoribonuclease (3'-5' exoribonuclease)
VNQQVEFCFTPTDTNTKRILGAADHIIHTPAEELLVMIQKNNMATDQSGIQLNERTSNVQIGDRMDKSKLAA